MKKYKLLIVLGVCVAFVAMLMACGKPQTAPTDTKEQPKQEQKQEKKEEKKAEKAPDVDNSYVITAAEWKDKFPKQYETYMMNSDDSYDYPGAPTELDYTKDYPAIQEIYKGIDFSHAYDVPRGHIYALEDVKNIARAKNGANCLSCKSPNYIIKEKEMGDALYTANFDDMIAEWTEPISCYDCHGNAPGENFTVQRSNMVDAIQNQGVEIDPKMQTCAQCHNEYYFTEDTKAVRNGYKYGTDPDSILKFFNEINFVDYTNPDTGIGLIKVQHPDFETFRDSPHAKMGLVCADCHMAPYDGYHSHQLSSPFKNPDIVNNVCMDCHKGQFANGEELMKTVNDMQEKNQNRVRDISEKLKATTLDIAAKKDSLDKETFDQVAAKYRDAQFYWDFVFVENGDGFHNPQLAKDCLDKSEKLIEECNALLG